MWQGARKVRALEQLNRHAQITLVTEPPKNRTYREIYHPLPQLATHFRGRCHATTGSRDNDSAVTVHSDNTSNTVIFSTKDP